MAHRLSCSVACGIFPDQRSNPALAGGFFMSHQGAQVFPEAPFHLEGCLRRWSVSTQMLPRTREREWGAGPRDLGAGGSALPASLLPRGRGCTKGHVSDQCNGVSRLQGWGGGTGVPEESAWPPLGRGFGRLYPPRTVVCPWPLSASAALGVRP